MKESIFTWYDSASMDNWALTYLGNAVPSSSWVLTSNVTLPGHFDTCPETSGIRLSSDAVPYPRMESSATPLWKSPNSPKQLNSSLSRGLSYDRFTDSYTLSSSLSASFPNFCIFSFPPESSSSCLRLLSRLPIPSIFPSIACFRRQFLR